MRASFVLVSLLVSGVVILGACGEHVSSSVSIAPSVSFPKGLLDNTAVISLRVYEASSGVTCDAENGKAIGLTESTNALFGSDIADCPAKTAKFCADISLSRSKETRMFYAVAKSSSGATVAQGCTAQVIDGEQLPLAIKMVRFIADPVCGNNIVEAQEQCDPPGNANDPVCDESCHSRDVLLSPNAVVSDRGPSPGVAGAKTRPRFVWPAQSGAAGRFLAAWGDRSKVVDNSEVAFRILDDTLHAMTDLGPEVSGGSLYWATKTGTDPEPNSQSAPAVAVLGSKYYVALEDDSNASIFAIRLRSTPTNTPRVGDQDSGASLAVSTGTTVQFAPSIAARSSDSLLIVWQDGGNAKDKGAIKARKFTPSGAKFENVVDVSDATGNQNAAVAATSTGWVVVWESSAGIKMRAITDIGTVVPGGDVTVSDTTHKGVQTKPAIAALDDGRFAIAWADEGADGGSDIFVQRFNADRSPVAGDQATRVNDLVFAGKQSSPAIAAASASDGFFAIGWVDEGSSDVRGRLLGATGGYRFNNVDGKVTEFAASATAGRTRKNPVIAIGGALPYIVFGWEDASSSAPGIYGRRFPAAPPAL